uniref:Protein GAPT n=1 Tax=Phascolarctos cinereus TaxID=38626 RepID=A0A6P5JK76_PHACI|nr:protein GAPT [Phascolarctos cinereus]
MTDHSAFFLHFLLYHLHPSLSTSHCEYVKNKTVDWDAINKSLHNLYLNNCDVKQIEYKGNDLPCLALLNLSSNQIETLPDQFLFNTSQDVHLYLKENKLNYLPNSILQNKKLKICSLDCILRMKFSLWSNACDDDTFEKCAGGSELVPLIVTLLLAILLLCGLGLACYWKFYHHTSNFALPIFLQKKRDQDDADAPHTPRPPSEYTGPKRFSPCEIKDEPSPLSRDDMDQSYENVETGPVSCAEECLTDLYENTAQFNSEHLYGNEFSSEYYNFQKPHCLNMPPDEDIYVLPD